MRADKLDELSGQEQASPSIAGQESAVKHTEGYVTDLPYKHHEAVTTPSRNRISEPSSSSPKGSRLHKIHASPTWRNASGFIKQSAGLGDDPFIAQNTRPKSPDSGKLFSSIQSRDLTYILSQTITSSNLASIGSMRGSVRTMHRLCYHRMPVSSWQSESSL